MKRQCFFLNMQHIFGYKWSLPLFFEFREFENNKVTFNQLKKKANSKINATLLSNTLKSFENVGLIEKFESGKIYYSLTNFGEKMAESLQGMKTSCLNYTSENCERRSCLNCEFFNS